MKNPCVLGTSLGIEIEGKSGHVVSNINFYININININFYMCLYVPPTVGKSWCGRLKKYNLGIRLMSILIPSCNLLGV